MSERESLDLARGPEPSLHPVNVFIEVFWAGVGETTLVDLQRVAVADIDVETLLIDLDRIYPGRQDKRCIHRPAPGLREVGPGEVDQPIQEEHNTVLVTIALPAEDTVCNQGMVLCNRQAVDSVIERPDRLPGDNLIADDKPSLLDRDTVPYIHLKRPYLPQVAGIPDQHSVVRGDCEDLPPPRRKPDQVRRGPVNRDRGDLLEAGNPLGIDAPCVERLPGIGVVRPHAIKTGL